MISTSEVAVSVTIDDNKNLNLILEELKSFGTIEVDTDQSIICIVGNHAFRERRCIKRCISGIGYCAYPNGFIWW
jgi:aspartate kinase